jgi:hypothetical protein
MSSSPEKKTPSSLKSEASPPVEIKEAIAPANASGQRFRKRWLALIFVPLLATRFTYTRRGTSITAVPAAYMLCSENGNQIYTVEEESPTVACLGVRAGEILATGEKSTSNASPSSRMRVDHRCGSISFRGSCLEELAERGCWDGGVQTPSIHHPCRSRRRARTYGQDFPRLRFSKRPSHRRNQMHMLMSSAGATRCSSRSTVPTLLRVRRAQLHGWLCWVYIAVLGQRSSAVSSSTSWIGQTCFTTSRGGSKAWDGQSLTLRSACIAFIGRFIPCAQGPDKVDGSAVPNRSTSAGISLSPRILRTYAGRS